MTWLDEQACLEGLAKYLCKKLEIYCVIANNAGPPRPVRVPEMVRAGTTLPFAVRPRTPR